MAFDFIKKEFPKLFVPKTYIKTYFHLIITKSELLLLIGCPIIFPPLNPTCFGKLGLCCLYVVFYVFDYLFDALLYARAPIRLFPV